MSGSPLIFIAHVDELMERFDPRYVAFCRRAAEFRYPLVRLSKLLSAPPEYGAGEAGVPRIDIRQPRYIRITDVNDDGELLPGLGATAETVEDRYILHDGDLLFARSGATVGKCYLHESEKVGYPCFYAGYMIRFRLGARVLPNYVFAFTQTPYYRDWVAAIQRSAAQPNINAQEYSSLQIPVPPLDVQKQIVAELDAAYEAKRNADEKASRLLASIDEVIFSELGIPPLPPQDTSLRARMFIVPARKLVHRRLDASFYKQDYISFDRILSESPNKVGAVSEFEIDVFQGVGRNLNEKDGIHLLKVKNIQKDGTIDYEDVEPVSNVPSSKRLVKGDIIAPFIGAAILNFKFGLFNGGKDGKYAVDNNTGVFRILSNDLSSEYLWLYFQSALTRIQLERLVGGGGVPYLGTDNARQIKVVVPSISVQLRIIKKVTAIREEAKRLKTDAAEALVAAKSRLENQLLCSGSS
jgi:restriction endonuclease S subunit